MSKALLKSASTGMIRLAEILVGSAFLVLIVAVTIQVIGRSGLFDSPIWTEELTRFGLLYMTAFGVGLSYLSGDMVNVDIVCDRLPGRLPWLLRLVCAVIIIILCVALMLPAWKYTAIGAFQTSPALGWQMNYIHASMLVLLGILLLFALIRMCSLLAEVIVTTSNKEIKK